LHTAVGEFLRRVDVLPWDSEVAERYGATRAAMERQGKTLGPLDLLIASHARCAEGKRAAHPPTLVQMRQAV